MSSPAFRRVLIANRGEIAVRIARTLRDLGIEPVAVAGEDDGDALHFLRATSRVLLPGRGVRAYLDGDAVVGAARNAGCEAVHPGYGFLSENPAFAQACEQAGLVFIGPTVEQLVVLGDKIAARTLAIAQGVPVLEGSAALNDAGELDAFIASLGAGATAVIKAASGGGGRGMQPLYEGVDRVTAFSRCADEARAAFGDGTLYAERFVPAARHIEVQILGDGHGGVVHLWERDCSLQRRHQKLIEIAPAPALPAALREALLADAVRMAKGIAYRGLGTFEFLVDVESRSHWFIEANPRLQVEHTVTEEVLGLDLVALQMAVAGGKRLADLGLAQTPPAPAAFAVQLRINAETFAADGSTRPAGGTVSPFEVASGPGVRVDSGVYGGYAVNPAFDSLLAKLIVRSTSTDFAQALRRAEAAAAEFTLAGVGNNLLLLRAVLRSDSVVNARMTTRFIETHLAELLTVAAEMNPAQSATEKAHVARDVYIQNQTHGAMTAGQIHAPPGAQAVTSPLRGLLVSCDVAAGMRVVRGTLIATVEAMKMHHLIEAPCSGEIVALAVQAGVTVDEGQVLVFLRADEIASDADAEVAAFDLDGLRADLNELNERHAFLHDAQRPEAVAKRRKLDSRTARENIADLCDEGSFIEYGALAVAAQRRRRTLDDLIRNTPADGLITGFGTVNAAQFGEDNSRCAVLAYDYTVLAGTQGAMNHKKTDRLFELAREWQSPVVFFTEGGGGRPGDVDIEDVTGSWLDIPTFASWPQLSGQAPRIAINHGRCFAGNAVLFGCADFTIATRASNIGLAGPAMIEGGGLGKFSPEDIGPADVQAANGVIDVVVENEAEGVACAKKILGYFQGRVREHGCSDQRALRHLVPQNRLRAYDMRAVIDTLVDDNSVTELRRAYGVGIITALIRIEGIPFGLMANDPRHLGGAIDSPAAEKAGRFLQLCDVYGLPVLSLCDTPGFMVGPESEKTAAVRRGSRLLMAGANLSVPLFTVVTRKGYGLGAQAMAGGSFHRAFMTASWPTGEFGPMGLEGAVNLGFRKELDAQTDPVKKQALFDRLLAKMYEQGKGVNVGAFLEIDTVIDPAQTREWVVRALRAAGPVKRATRRYVDVW